MHNRLMLRFYNTLTNQKEDFVPLIPGQVSIYNCGPTVYDYVHIGNLRSFLFADLLARYLEFRGFEVRQVMNITDVGHMLDDDEAGEDRMAKGAEREQLTPWQVADKYTDAFLADAAKLKLREPLARPRATAYVDPMIAMIQTLLEKGHAYTANGSVYFDITTFPDYGKLSGKNLEELQAGARIEPHPDKRSPFDFALWIHNPKHVMQWEAPWGSGYPGWHIECSAMIESLLGPTIDIHTGGEDNIFPHHECEIAQSTGAHDAPLARYWLHARFLLVDDAKMSKSKGNFYRLADLEEKGFYPNEVRFALMRAHYRSTLNFSLEALEDARATLKILNAWVARLETAVLAGETTRENERAIEEAEAAFRTALDDDLNITDALAALFGLKDSTLKRLTKSQLRRSDALAVIAMVKRFDEVLQVLQFTPQVALTPEVRAMLQSDIERRKVARDSKEWAIADQIRDRWAAQGVIFEDIAEGTRWITADGEAGLVTLEA